MQKGKIFVYIITYYKEKRKRFYKIFLDYPQKYAIFAHYFPFIGEFDRPPCNHTAFSFPPFLRPIPCFSIKFSFWRTLEKFFNIKY